jgi:hypothetical protein
MPKTYFVLCPNQMALTIAIGLAATRGATVMVFAIYWPGRCTVADDGTALLRYVPFSRWNCIRLWLCLRWRGAIEVLVPHRKLGRFPNFFAALCSTVSLVDDGMDTFRETPRNVEPHTFPRGTQFYTFRYPIELAGWLARFDVRAVADLHSLAKSDRRPIDLTGVRRLVVESPPLNKISDQLHLDEPETQLVAHSNPSKRCLQASGRATVQGASIALEASLKNFSGEVVVGESMVAIFALSPSDAPYRVTIWLDRKNVPDLKSFIAFIEKRDFSTLKLC